MCLGTARVHAYAVWKENPRKNIQRKWEWWSVCWRQLSVFVSEAAAILGEKRTRCESRQFLSVSNRWLNIASSRTAVCKLPWKSLQHLPDSILVTSPCPSLLVHTLIHSFTHIIIHSFTNSLIHSLTYSLIHSSLIHSLIYSFIHSHIHSFTHIHSFIHSLVHSVMHSFAYSFTHYTSEKHLTAPSWWNFPSKI